MSIRFRPTDTIERMRDPQSAQLGRLGSMLALAGIVVAAMAIFFLMFAPESDFRGPPAIPALSALITILTAGWVVFIARSDQSGRESWANAKQILGHMSTVGFVGVIFIAILYWLRTDDEVLVLLCGLVAIQGPLAIYLASRIANRTVGEK